MAETQIGGSARTAAAHVTEYPSLTDSRPSEYALTVWATFVAGLEQRGHPELADKRAGKLWSPVKLQKGAARGNASVLEISALVIDLDDTDPEPVLAALSDDGLAWCFHTTWSHTPESPRGRAIVPLCEPVMGRAWLPLWRAAVAKYAGAAADRQCKDVSRAYWYPYRKPGDTAYLILSSEGRPLSPSELGSAPELARVAPIESHRSVSRQTLSTLATKWKRSADPKRADLGIRLARAMQGEALAERGERDTILFALCGAIVEAYPDCSPESVAEALAQSIERMALESPDGAPSRETVIDKLQRCKAYRQEREQSRHAGEFDKRAQLSRFAFGADRSEPYDAAEVALYAQTLGIEETALRFAWIVQHQTDYYVLGPGCSYALAKRESLVNTAKTVLAPAPVALWDDEGSLISYNDLLERHSCTVQSVVRSLVAQTPRLDLARSSLTLPTCPRRALQPQYSADVDLWLNVLGGEQAEALKDWLALSTNLQTPSSALVMLGAPAAGKSLLAQGLARIWSTDGATSIDDAMGAFNDPLERCPVVFADEKLPRDYRGNVRSEELRRLIQETKRQSNRKNRAQCPLEGAIRLLIAANNDSLLDFRQHLSVHDVSAIGERFFHLPITDEAAQVLEEIGGRPTIEREWLQGDRLPAHILWLVANRTPQRLGRFGVSHDSKAVADRVAIRSGLRAAICEWIVRALEDNARRFVDRDDQCCISRGSMVLHISALTEHWEVYMKGEAKPKTAHVAAALEGLTSGKLEGPDRTLHVIDTEKLKAWAETHGYVTPAFIDRKLQELSET